MLGPLEVRELATRLDVSPTKKLGQNFVVDANTVRKIVRLAGVQAGEHIVEVGPGLGSLTLGLLEFGARVTAVEIDHRLAAELPATVAAMQPGAEHRLRVVHSDALEVNTAQLAEPASGSDAAGNGATLPVALVANLPYNVSVPILMHLLELLPSLQRGLVMVQAEVGHRLAAPPGSKAYGAPSAKVAWYGSWRIAGTVSRRIFWPVPGVDSNLVAFQRAAEPLGTEAERHLSFALVNAAFAGRRKMLRQSLQGVCGIPAAAAEASATIAAAGIDPTARAEQLAITDFLALARVLRSDPCRAPGQPG